MERNGIGSFCEQALRRVIEIGEYVISETEAGDIRGPSDHCVA